MAAEKEKKEKEKGRYKKKNMIDVSTFSQICVFFRFKKKKFKMSLNVTI